MGVSDMPHLIVLSRKRCRSEDASPFADPLPPHKLASLDPPPAPYSHSHHLTYLEELESSLDASSLESPTPEDLVTEMMQSLERVIGDSEELSAKSEPLDEKALSPVAGTLPALPETRIREPEFSSLISEALVIKLASEASDLEHSISTSPGLPLAELSNASSSSHVYSSEQNSEAGDCSHAGVDIRLLLEVSDDELGIPAASLNPENDVSAYVSDDDWSLLDESCSDSADIYDASQDGGVYAQIMMGGWLDNECGFGHGEEVMSDFGREQGGVIMLDGYL